MVICSLIGLIILLTDTPNSTVTAAAIGCAVLQITSLWWRRKFPLAVTLLGFAGNAATGVSFSAYIGLFALATRRRDRLLAALATLGYAIAVSAAVFRNNVSLPDALLAEFFNHGVTIALGAYIGARRDLIQSLELRAQRAESERELWVERARLAERNRIAREMHDVLAHRVSLISLHAGGLEVMPSPTEAAVRESAQLIRNTARQALEDLREVLGVLRAGNLAESSSESIEGLRPTPTLAHLSHIISESRAAGIKLTVDLHWPIEPPELLGRTAFRIVQEGLTNVHKHARSAATHVLVSGNSGACLVVEITNRPPLRSDPPLPGSGLGLVGLAERVRLLGGQLTYGSTAAGGWFIRAELPWSAAAS